MEPVVPDFIRAIAPYVPGKPIEELEREYGLSGIVKLASNENALGASPMALEAMQQAMGRLHRYPDGSAYYLTAALARHLGVEEGSLVTGNGSDDVIAMAVRAFMRTGDKAVMPHPAFLMYDILVKTAGGVAVPVNLDGMDIALDAMAAAVDADTRMVFVTNPNNPTGRFIPQDKMRAFLNAIPPSVLVLLDEAYVEFVAEDKFYSGISLLEEYPNLLILRTFSKAYGLAGIRVGYGVMAKEVAQWLHRVRQPFNVNLLAQAAACAALDDVDFLNRTKALVRDGKTWLFARLEEMGLRAHETEANFFLIDVKREGKAVFEAMLRKGVIVRSMHGYGFPRCIRVTVGLPEENEIFISALKEVLADIPEVSV
ncbi:histidinol phosphate aminotransferase [Desulfobotulus alkaliphilus]|uniref:Histidinol-phosphate aminotransferase n=1 Tax=Desulfobotulus alkaliphilus TaxID=622671 RepID=A0A562RS77_9BACT|nr:histidinol-phosphate transaminase [Desulfobotulus alkaliphilus]TWI71220.1 histidinol phosphate aminotransferase [Desulfobotulus alkaliphilus]